MFYDGNFVYVDLKKKTFGVCEVDVSKFFNLSLTALKFSYLPPARECCTGPEMIPKLDLK